MNSRHFGLAILAGALSVCSCSLGPGKPVSDLVAHPLKKDGRHGAFDGIWLSGHAALPSTRVARSLYIAPVSTRFLKKGRPEMAAYMAGEFGDSLNKEVGKLLASQASGGKWAVSQTPREPGVTLELAIVKLEPASVTGKIAAVGAIPLPVPGVSFLLNEFSKGSVGIEGRVIDNATHRPLVEFAACNSDPINIFSCNQFEQFACDKYNLDRFADDVAQLLPTVGVGQRKPPSS